MLDDDLSPVLASAYAEAEQETQPSDLLLQRTVRALQGQGILKVPVRRRLGRQTVTGLVAGVAGFFLGVVVPLGRGVGTPSPVAPVAEAGAANATSESPIEELQRAGTAYATALERVVVSARRADAATLGGAQAVYLAAVRAQRPYGRILLVVPDRLPDSKPQGDADAARGKAVIWF